MKDKSTILITGVSTGIGRASAALFARQGYRVFGGVRQPDKVEPLAGVELLALDVNDDTSVAACVAQVLGRAGHLRALVNNAGYTVLGAIEETGVAEAKAIFDTNFFGVLRMSQAVLPALRAAGGGTIVNVSSVLGFLPGPYMGVYSATKHALEALSETLDHEVRTFGVRVVLVEPGFTRTRIEANATRVGRPIAAYDAQRERVLNHIDRQIAAAPTPEVVAREVLKAVERGHRMRRPVGFQPGLLSRLRRFLPAPLVDRSIRQEFRLDR